MAKYKPSNPTKNKMEFEIDLEKEFGFKFKSKALMETVGQALIDTMVERTQSNQKLTGGKFAKYSDAYAKKKGTEHVDLTLTEDMLSSIDVKAALKSQKIKIFVDSEETPKAFNHHTGDTVKKREWFGVQSKEMKSIVSEFKKEAKTSDIEEDEDAILEALTKGLFDFG